MKTEQEIEAKAKELYKVACEALKTPCIWIWSDDQETKTAYMALARHVLGIAEETEDEAAGRRAKEAFFAAYNPMSHDGSDPAAWIAAAKAARDSK